MYVFRNRIGNVIHKINMRQKYHRHSTDFKCYFTLGRPMPVFEELKTVLETIHPHEKELNKRPLPWPSNESRHFGTRGSHAIEASGLQAGRETF